MNRRFVALLVMLAISLSAQAESLPARDPSNPLPYLVGEPTDSEQVALGESVFTTKWTAAGLHSGTGRSGLGPLFNAVSCEACHDDRSRAVDAANDGLAPTALVIQLEAPPGPVGAEPAGDPVYGHILNTRATSGMRAEGVVKVRYTEMEGRYYPDGIPWRMRLPHYSLKELQYGPLAPTTVIKPRLAPSLFGVGLLEAVPDSAITDEAADGNSGQPAWQVHEGRRMLGRFGWQGAARSIRDQTTRALAREMGLTSADLPSDDCTPAEADCLRQAAPAPEVSEELLAAVVAFVRTRAIPKSPYQEAQDSPGSRLFGEVGCAGCHRPRMPVLLREVKGTPAQAVIAPYTDLRLHNLGAEMADENASGAKVPSSWRTAPLWGLGYRIGMHAPLLHDGRARDIEEAILWHSGDAARARRKFVELGPRARQSLLRWLKTL
jgi:CxxC motif-containing protein (DUF1111 family)